MSLTYFISLADQVLLEIKHLLNLVGLIKVIDIVN